MSDGTQRWGMSVDRPAPPPQPRSAAHRLLGGPPLMVAIRLAFVSLVVGAIMMWLDIQPFDVLNALVDTAHRLWAMGFEAIGRLGRYFLAGAVIVVPLWLIARLLNIRGAR